MQSLESAYSAKQILRFIREKKEDFWLQLREKRALALFHLAARRVPAYKDFLKRNKINANKIKTWADFQNVPPVDKKNYLRKYPLEKLHWDGTVGQPMVFTATSGSTGEPFYFSRDKQLDWQYSILAELYLQNSSHGISPTLVIVCFGMGVWIGGLITYKAFEIASQRGNYPVSIITPGINKEEIFNVLRKLAPHYAQTIIIGYPPFVKDILDQAPERGIDLKKLHIRLLFAAEAFTEKFRSYVVKTAQIPSPFLDTLNIYGTADIGAMASETPLTILIRRLAMQNKKLFKALFSQIIKSPTLTQYNPLFITFVALNDGEILLTGINTIPLIRYAVGDHGGVFSLSDAENKLREYSLELEREAIKNKIGGHIYSLPFVYVYERSDFSTKLYGAIIHPEPVREALQAVEIQDSLTGKFTMFTKFDRKQNEFLEINMELKPSMNGSIHLENIVRELVIRSLLEKNSEYGAIYRGAREKTIPKFVFWPYEHPLYFKEGIKQKWVLKK